MNNIWQSEPAWLQKKRQLATILRERFPKTADQDAWLTAWQDAQPGEGTNWLSSNNEGIVALPLAKAVSEYPELLQENLMEKAVRWQDSQLNAAHLANIDCGQFIYVPSNTKVNGTVSFNPRLVSTNPHNVIIVGSGVTLTIEETVTDEEGLPTFAATEILVGAGSTVTYRQANNYSAPLTRQAIHAYQAHGSTLNLVLANSTSREVKTSLYSFLDGNDTGWNAIVGLSTEKSGHEKVQPVVDGFGKGTRAHLATLSRGANIDIAPLKTGSGEPLAIATETLDEQKTPKWLSKQLQ